MNAEDNLIQTKAQGKNLQAQIRRQLISFITYNFIK